MEQLSALALIGFINFLTSISLGLFVLLKNTRHSLNRIYFLTNLSVAIYSLGYALWQSSRGSMVASAAWFNVLFTGTILIHIMYLPFVYALTEKLFEKRIEIAVFSAINVLFILAHQSGLLYQELVPKHGLGFWPVPKISLSIYIIFWHLTSAYGFWRLIEASRRNPGIKGSQLKFVAVACIIGYIGGASNWPLWYGIYFPPYPSIAISVYVGIIAYAIVRHRLMDFGLLIRWGLAYSFIILLLGTCLLLLVMLSEFFSNQYFHLNRGTATLFFACVLTLVFARTKNIVQKFVDKIIFRSPDLHIILEKIDQTVFQSKNVQDLSIRLSEQLKQIWATDHAGILVWDFTSSCYTPLPATEFEKCPLKKLKEKIGKGDFLIRTLETEKRLFWQGVITEDEVTVLGNKSFPGEKITFWKIRRTMRWLGAAVCIPLLSNNDLIGFMVLGNKKNSGIFNNEDKKFLSHVAEKISSAVISLFDNLKTEDQKFLAQNMS